MRFLTIHKLDEYMEDGNPPIPEVVEGMGALVRESAGIFISGAGLHRSAERIRLTVTGTTQEVSRGPFDGENELVARFAMIRVRSMQDALAQAQRYADVLGEAEIEIGPVVEPWDLGLISKPESVESTRFLLLVKSDARSEGEIPFDPETIAALVDLEAELREAGILLSAERLAPSARAARLAAGPKGERTWVDGPFTESKELVAGFSLVRFPTREEAIAWAERYAAILHGNEVDVQEVLDD